MPTINPLLKLKPQDFFSIYKLLRTTFTTNEFIKTIQETLDIEVTAKHADDYLSCLGFTPFGDSRNQYRKSSVVGHNTERCLLRRNSMTMKSL